MAAIRAQQCARGGGKEAPAPGGGGDKGEYGDGLRGLRAIDPVGPSFYIPGEGDDGGG